MCTANWGGNAPADGIAVCGCRQHFIAASLVDGVLTPEERNIIIKRALLEGNDPDEVNLLLDAEVQKIRQQKQAAQPKLNKCAPRSEGCGKERGHGVRKSTS